MIRKLLCWLGWHNWRLIWCREDEDCFTGYIKCKCCQVEADLFFPKYNGKVKR